MSECRMCALFTLIFNKAGQKKLTGAPNHNLRVNRIYETSLLHGQAVASFYGGRLASGGDCVERCGNYAGGLRICAAV